MLLRCNYLIACPLSGLYFIYILPSKKNTIVVSVFTAAAFTVEDKAAIACAVYQCHFILKAIGAND